MKKFHIKRQKCEILFIENQTTEVAELRQITS